MITVKASKQNYGHGPRYENRYEMHLMKNKSYEVLLPVDYFPHARASYVKQWYKKDKVCGTTHEPKQWWCSVEPIIKG